MHYSAASGYCQIEAWCTGPQMRDLEKLFSEFSYVSLACDHKHPPPPPPPKKNNLHVGVEYKQNRVNHESNWNQEVAKLEKPGT